MSYTLLVTPDSLVERGAAFSQMPDSHTVSVLHYLVVWTGTAQTAEPRRYKNHRAVFRAQCTHVSKLLSLAISFYMIHAKKLGNPVLFCDVLVQTHHQNLHISPQSHNTPPPKPRGQDDLVLGHAQLCTNA